MFEIVQRVAKRQWGKMAAVFVLVLGLVVAVTLLSAKTYASEAKLVILLGRETATLGPTATFGQGTVVALPPTRENDIGTAIEIIRSRVLLEAVIDRVGVPAVLGT